MMKTIYIFTTRDTKNASFKKFKNSCGMETYGEVDLVEFMYELSKDYFKISVD